jgi:hypothetical protein
VLEEVMIEGLRERVQEISSTASDAAKFGTQVQIISAVEIDTGGFTNFGELRRGVVYGIATDDSHTYTRWGVGQINPGRGWIMVRSTRPTPDSIAAAVRRGDFYASAGVTLRGADLRPRAAEPAAKDAPGRSSSRYSDDIGRVLSRVEGTQARYVLGKDDVYVRARVVSSRLHPNPYRAGDVEMAWTQPVVGPAVTVSAPTRPATTARPPPG